MWIKKDEYERLRDCEQMRAELEKEVVRLSEIISAKVEDCKIGPWCKDCKHIGCDRSVLRNMDVFMGSYIKEVAGVVQYCKKHLHETCPEFETR